MEEVNKCIACDVIDCKYNALGKNCKLSCIKVTGHMNRSTCCGSYKPRI